MPNFGKIGLYVDGTDNLQKLHELWEHISDTGFNSLCVNAFCWVAPDLPNTGKLNVTSFLSDSSIRLENLCASTILRVLLDLDGSTDNTNSLQFLDSSISEIKLSSVRRKDRPNFLGDQIKHCSLFASVKPRPVVMLPYAPDKIFEYGLQICSFLSRTSEGQEILDAQDHEQFWIKMPLGGFQDPSQVVVANGERNDASALEAYKWWIRLKSVLGNYPNIRVSLEISEDLLSGKRLVNYWRSEPVTSIIVPTSIFLINQNGLPYLSRHHQELLEQFLQLHNVEVFLCPGELIEHEKLSKIKRYVGFLRNLCFTANSQSSTQAVIFSPLQPLHQNLNHENYESFELDNRKYADYEEAIRRFLVYRQSLPEVPDPFVVAVVGCGRGPLVTAAINAAKCCSARLKIFALEKNPLVVPVLKETCITNWQGTDVKIVLEDMRSWTPPEKLDILLSELLGSFGDNELSPECLSGPEKYLKVDGVSIPSSYTSFLCPMTSTKICDLINKNAEYSDSLKEMALGFEVDFYRRLDVPRPVFSFYHPSLSDNQIKDRFVTLTFFTNAPGILHGFAGYFKCVLFGEIEHSLLPDDPTQGLITWNNIVFPVTQPFIVEEGDKVCVHFWRRSDSEFVWYEWALSSPITSKIHNFGGKKCRMALNFASET